MVQLKTKSLAAKSTATILNVPRSIAMTIFALSLSVNVPAQATKAPISSHNGEPPKTWIDADTGHRVTRLTDLPGSSGLYFNINAYTPDKREMIYTSPAGIHILDLQSFQSRTLYEGKISEVLPGTTSRTVYFKKPGDDHLYSIGIDHGEIKQLALLPSRAVIDSVNADESLIAGTILEGNAPDFITYKLEAQKEANKVLHDSAVAAANHPGTVALTDPGFKVNETAMQRRLDARSPEDLFIVDLKSGKTSIILKGQDWLNHVQFSPTDSTLLLYAHEGPATKVDRVWTIRSDGSQNYRIHTRTAPDETVNHEFWGHDGRTIFYDLQQPEGKTFYLAGYNISTHEEKLFHLDKATSSVHFNSASGDSAFCADGRSTDVKTPSSTQTEDKTPWSRQWIELLKPIPNDSQSGTDPRYAGWFSYNNKGSQGNIRYSGWFQSEHLVNLSKNDYKKIEPNVRFSPDDRFVIFTSNMFGPTYIFAVEVN
jgi:oligogalacturonide lyase